MGVLTGCKPRAEILKGDLNDNIFAAEFGTLIEGKADPVYGDAQKFFANTHPAKQLKKVVEIVFERLAAPNEQGAVIGLSTGFGGGKTHTLMALWHLAKNVDNAALGTELLPVAGRPKTVTVIAVDAGKAGSNQFASHGNVVVKSLWGELFYQMGGKDALKILGNADDPEASPSESQIEQVLPKGPTLILLDELVIYMARLSSRGQGNMLGFINSLTAVVARQPQTVLIITDPAGQAAYQQETEELKRVALTAAAMKLDEMFARRISDFDPIGDESAQVIVRRLLESIDGTAAQQASASYHSLYQRIVRDTPNLLPPYAANKAYAERILACYPFHPRLLDTAQDRLGAMQDFQKSRGVLRLFARIIRDTWDAKQDHELISGGDIIWTSPRIQADLLHRLNRDNFKSAVSADIEIHAGELDGTAPRGIHRRVASALLIESLPLQPNSGLDPAEVTLAVLRPDEAGPEPSEALDRLVGCCWHTYPMAGGRGWQFRYEPNIIKQIEERKSQIPLEDARKRVMTEAQGYFSGPTFKLTPWPSTARQVPELAELQLALCESEKLAHSVCANNDDTNPTAPMPRGFVNSIVAIAPSSQNLNAAVDKAQRLLAAEAIEREHRTGEQNAIIRSQLDRLRPELKKQFRIQTCRAFDRVVFAGGTAYPLEEQYQVSDDLILQDRSHGQACLMKFLEGKDLIYRSTDAYDVDKFLRDVLPGATHQMDNPHVYTGKAVHERFLSVRGLRLMRDKGMIQQTILKALAEGKIVAKTDKGIVFDKDGSVEGSDGRRRRMTNTLSSAPLDETLFIARSDTETAKAWIKVDPEVGSGEIAVPTRKQRGRIIARNWEQAIATAADRPLLNLKLKATSPASAQRLISLAQPLSALQLSLEVTISGDIKDGGQIDLSIRGIQATHQMKPIDVSQKLYTSMREGSSFQADLIMEFGVSGRAGMSEQLQSISKDAPDDITPEAMFDEQTGE